VPSAIALYVLLTVEARHVLLGLAFIAAIPLAYLASRRLKSSALAKP